MVPSDCMIMSIDGSGGAEGASEGREPPLRITTVLEAAAVPAGVGADEGCTP